MEELLRQPAHILLQLCDGLLGHLDGSFVWFDRRAEVHVVAPLVLIVLDTRWNQRHSRKTSQSRRPRLQVDLLS